MTTPIKRYSYCGAVALSPLSIVSSVCSCLGQERLGLRYIVTEEPHIYHVAQIFTENYCANIY